VDRRLRMLERWFCRLRRDRFVTVVTCMEHPGGYRGAADGPCGGDCRPLVEWDVAASAAGATLIVLEYVTGPLPGAGGAEGLRPGP
jgi:hypothetical protein